MKFLTEIIDNPLSLLLEADSTGKKQLYIQGPFAVAESKNKNGRIYKKEILEGAINKYDQDYIKSSRALGEMNHPCFRPGANVFVQGKGLIPIEDVAVGDYVFGTDDNSTSKPVLVLETTKNMFSGNLIKFNSRAFNAEVTPYHRFYLKNLKDKFRIVTAQEIKDDIVGRHSLKNYYIPRTLQNWVGVERKTIILSKQIDRISHKEFNSYADTPLEINMKDFCAFMGIYLSEGCGSHYTRKDRSETPGSIFIAQNLGIQNDLILDLVSRLGVFRYEVLSSLSKPNSGGVLITDIRLADYLHKFGNVYDKYIPSEILESTKENITEFLDWYHLGDGTNSKSYSSSGKEYIHSSIFTVSEKMADGLIECIIKIGKSTIKKICVTKTDYMYAGHLIKAENKKPLFALTIGKHRGKGLDSRMMTTTDIPYEGYVYCLVTETGNFFVEQNKSVFLSGNCRLSIDYERATHMITEMKQDVNQWIGKAKVLNTPMGNILKGLLESGVNVGVSTRGAGSITESDGIKHVGPDYFLTAVDCVSDPSGPGAFVKGLMEGFEYILDEKGQVVVEEIAAQAKSDYDKKTLTEARKVQLFQKLLEAIK